MQVAGCCILLANTCVYLHDHQAAAASEREGPLQCIRPLHVSSMLPLNLVAKQEQWVSGSWLKQL
jgi:hypothetical protein